jgi:acetyl-CoA/propionyl-CoA carboxylase biotin carboxyl carrier protein
MPGWPMRRTRSGGDTSAETYLRIDKLIAVAQQSGADAVHPRVRLPGRERRVRRGGDGGRTDLDRPDPAGDPRPRRQGDRATHRPTRRGASRTGHPGTGRGSRRGDRVRAGARASGRHQGGVRRRRPRSQGRPDAGGDPGAARVGDREAVAAFGRGRVLRGALPGQARATSRPRCSPTSTATSSWSAPRTARCSAATRSSSRRPRRRSSPRAARRDPQLGQGDLPRGRLPRARHSRVPGRLDGTISFLEVQHPAAGRAPGDRGDLGHRPRPRAVPHRRRREAALRRRPRAARALRSSSGSTARTPGRNFLPAPGHRSTLLKQPEGPGVRVDTHRVGRGPMAATSTPCWPR